MAEGASPRAAGECGNERDTEPERVREMLMEILMEMPGFRTLTERGIPLEILEGAQGAVGTSRPDGPTQATQGLAQVRRVGRHRVKLSCHGMIREVFRGLPHNINRG